MLERRRFSRFPFEERVEFLCAKGSFIGRIRDFSLGGLYIECEEGFPELQEEIALIFFLRDTDPSIKIFMKGEVLRKEPSGFAVRITSINEESFHHIKNYCFYNIQQTQKAEEEIQAFLKEFHPVPKMLKMLNLSYLKGEIMPYLLERAFLYSPEKPFKLASGKESPYYLDCRKITLYGPTYKLIGELFWEALRAFPIEGVAGMSIGADPIVCAILSSAQAEGVNLEGLLIRKEPKKYGTAKQIEGHFYPHMKIALVEDVVTTGGSLMKAIEACERENLEIVKVLSLVDREEGGKARLKEAGYELFSFFTLSEIISAFHQKTVKL